MLNLRHVEQLEDILRLRVGRLGEILADCSHCYEELMVTDPARPDKGRKVLNVTNPIRELQTRLYRRVLVKKVKPSPYSHGGIRKRSVMTNAKVHRHSRYLLKADISDFYPSISHKRIYNIFAGPFACSADVARLCTKLCTYNYHLAVGLVTSTILADQVLAPVDRRIAGLCEKANLHYSRFVDDVTISGDFDLQQSGIPASVMAIMQEHGFNLHPAKWVFGEVENGPAITGVCIRNGHFDVSEEYAASIEEQIEDLRRLEGGEDIPGPIATRSQLWGRINYVRWINGDRGETLGRMARNMHWGRILHHASKQGLVTGKRLFPNKRTE